MSVLTPPSIDRRAGDDHDATSEPRRDVTPRSSRRSTRSWRSRRVGVHGRITALIGALATVAYTWNLWNAGNANGYYAAAVKSASLSWKAWFFGALDPGSFITVDKPPVATWIMGLSARVFGFSTLSMLLPEAIAGVASVLIVHHVVRRWRGDVAAHLAAVAFALTPAAASMFRYNHPDAVLTLLGVGAAWALWHAVETGRTRGLVLAGALTGLAFDTKMLQAFLVLPAFALVYLVAGPPRLGRRLLQLLAGLGALVVSSAWWVAVVSLWPASARPYIGSTTDNSIVSLVLGYNGLDRVFGSGTGAGGGPGGPGGSGFGGTPGILRLFNSEIGGQIAWLIPLALAGLAAGLWLTRRAPRTDRGRAGWLLWGGWAATCAAVFSLSKGVFHAYYTVQLAPALAALAGAGAIALWQLGRRHHWMIWALPAWVASTATLAVVLLDRTPTYGAWLRPLVAVTATIAVVALLGGQLVRNKRAVLFGAALAGVALLSGPAAYVATTVAHPGSGSIVLAGPTTAANGARAGVGGSTSTTSTGALVRYLRAHQGNAKYLVAGFGSTSTDELIIESGQPVVTIGGFNGGDPAPTLAQFEHLVATGQVRYVLVTGNGAGGGFGGGPRGGPGGGTTSAISSWVTAHGKAVDASAYGGSGTGTLYDVSGAA